MQIQLLNTSKLYNNQIVLKDLNFTFKANTKTAILGNNGSGKSTLCLLLAAQILPTLGKVIHTFQNNLIHPNQVFKQIAFTSPAMQLPLELNLIELLQFQNALKPLNISNHQIFDLCYFSKKNTLKPLFSFSSGMIQRIKLILNFCNSQSCIIVDEPTENLDTNGSDLYMYLLQNFSLNKTVIVATNRKNDIDTSYAILDLNSLE